MKKYDCTRTLDFGHERNRLCKSYENCEGCLLSGGHCVDYIFTEEQIRNLQTWSDEHPEKPKLTKREYEFLKTFHISIDKDVVRGKLMDDLYIHDVRCDVYLGIDSTMFSFIQEEEQMTFDELLKLEVEE